MSAILKVGCHVFILALAALGMSARADSPAPPRDYEQVTADGTHVFVMNSPRRGRGRQRPSGLYRQGDSAPLWTVDWYAFTVHLSSDGRYLVRQGPWASSFDNLAIAFYDRGRLLNAYAIHELVPDREE